MTIPIFITARTGSTRLPRKHFLKLGSVSVIEHIVRRCQHFGFKPYLCVPSGQQDEFAEHTSCKDIFGGDAKHVPLRLNTCARKFDIAQFHHLDGDDPFFCSDEVRNSMKDVENVAEIHASALSQTGAALCGTSINRDYTSPIHILKDTKHPWPQRLTLDYEEDYHLLCAVNRMVGGYMAPRWAVDELFVRNPDLHKINWHLTEMWKDRQLAESSR